MGLQWLWENFAKCSRQFSFLDHQIRILCRFLPWHGRLARCYVSWDQLLLQADGLGPIWKSPVPKATHRSSRLIIVKHSNSQGYDICQLFVYTLSWNLCWQNLQHAGRAWCQLLPENMGLVGQVCLYQSREDFLATCSEDCFISNELVYDLLR